MLATMTLGNKKRCIGSLAKLIAREGKLTCRGLGTSEWVRPLSRERPCLKLVVLVSR